MLTSTSPQPTPLYPLLETLAPLLRHPEDHQAPPYLRLLSLNQGKETNAALLASIKEHFLSLSQPREAIHALLQQTNWRFHLLAIAAWLVTQPAELTKDAEASPRTQDATSSQENSVEEGIALAAWTAFDACSWITPQLAAALSLRDPRFASAAEERLLHARIILGEGARQIEPIGNPEASTPNPPRFRQGSKGIAALFALYQITPAANAHIIAHIESSPLQQILIEETLIDRGAEIAKHWRERFLAASSL